MTTSSPKTILNIHGITKRFGGLYALNDVSFDVRQGEILGVIGPNGAGKTTLFDVITGRYKPTDGKVLFKESDITGLTPHKIIQKGISRSFQLEILFNNLDILQHIILSQHLHMQVGYIESFFRTSGSRKKMQAAEANALELLKFVGLEDQKDKKASELSHGYQRSLGIAVALGTSPEFLMLDEPLSALSPARVNMILDLIKSIQSQGITVMVIEHNMGALFRIADRIVVLNVGMKIAEGTPDQIKNNEDVINAYLGGDTVDRNK